jgi:transcriptional regulator with XRE-family HTH domain
MPDSTSPAVQRRRLRAELRRARLEAGMTQEQVAAEMEWSPSKVIRIETGSVGISTTDLRAIVDLYKVGASRAAELISLGRAARERSWWSAYRDVLSPRLLQFIEHEEAASVIRCFEPLLIPVLFQTEEYARAVLHQTYDQTRPYQLEALIEVRSRRQVLLERADPPDVYLILDEAAIRRLVGGHEAMGRQISRLAEAASRPNVTIEVIPFNAGAHPGMNGSFTIYEFSDQADNDIMVMGAPGDDKVFWDSQEQILAYRESFENLRGLSLGQNGSKEFLTGLAK